MTWKDSVEYLFQLEPFLTANLNASYYSLSPSLLSGASLGMKSKCPSPLVVPSDTSRVLSLSHPQWPFLKGGFSSQVTLFASSWTRHSWLHTVWSNTVQTQTSSCTADFKSTKQSCNITHMSCRLCPPLYISDDIYLLGNSVMLLTFY